MKSPVIPRLGIYLISFLLAVVARAERVTFSEIHFAPKDETPEYIELFNNSGSAVDFARWEFSNGIEYKFPDFSSGSPQNTFMCAFERVLVTNVDARTFRANYTVPANVKIFGPYGGSLNNAGEAIELKDKNGVLVCRVRYNDRGKWPVAADGAGHSIRLVNKYLSCSNFENWASSASPGGTPGSAPAGSEGQRFSNPSVDLAGSFPLVVLGSEWKYDESGDDLGSAWRQTDFDDATWPIGAGIFGRESSSRIAAMPEPKIQTVWPQRISTHYLRKHFQWQGGTDSAFFSMDAMLDDGLVVYLNGTEVGRHRMPAGNINFETNATSVPSTLEAKVEQRIIETDISGQLKRGTNTLAVEVHNNSSNSSDLVFGTEIRISGTGGTAIINEVKAGEVGDGFIEFYNSGKSEINLGGYHLTDDIATLNKFTIGDGITIPAGDFAAVGFKESGFSLGGRTKIYLSSPDAITVLDGFDASLGADGRSVGRKPAGGPDWFVFSDPTPAAANIDSGDLAGLLSLNEIHFTAEGTIDWIEIFANSSSAVPLAGLALASKRDFSDAFPLSGSVSGNTPKSWPVSFTPDAAGEVRVYLITVGGTVLAAELFRAREGVESYQSYPPGKEWYKGLGHTKDAANVPTRNTDVIVNEIMCDPPSDERNAEFIELYNRGTEAVDLGGWKFVEGVRFIFPQGTSIPAGGYLVIAANSDWLAANYNDMPIIGNYDNNLANEGELIRLEDATGNMVDEVHYKVGGDWPLWTNGGGSSLELIHPNADNDLPTSWKDSDEGQKTNFEAFTYSGVYHHLSVPRLDKELWVHLVGDAHVIFKDIELLKGGTDILENADRRTTNGRGETGWLPQGTHHASHFQANEFHLISDGHGDNRANKAEIQVNALNRNDQLTLSFQARWVKGKPRIVFKTFEDSFVSTFRLPIPNNLGSPGEANGTLLPAAPPALANLSHRPAVPSSGDAVTVSARVSGDAASVKLVYRQDSATNDREWKSVTMNDSGAAADSRAGDGFWTAQILDQGVDNRIVQFYVRASGPGGQETTLPSRAPGIPAMYVVDNTEIVTDVSSYRWVVSEYDRRSLSSGSSSAWGWKFPNLSNSYKKMTLVVDEQEVFYNCQIRPSASPWHAGDRSNFNKRGKWKLPKDRRLRGLSKLSWDNTPAAEGSSNIFNNKVPRYILYLMGHEVNENEFCTVIENGGAPRHSVELFEPVANDFLERNFGEDGPRGELYRADDVFFFDDNYSKDQITSRYWWYAGDDWPGPGRYHSQWFLRSREADYDYTALINLFKTVKTGNNYTEEEINRLVDARRICMMAAVRGYIGDWDSFTLRRPKNSFFYRPPGDGKFHFFFHDADLAYQNTGEMIHQGGSEFAGWLRKPYNRRIFRYYLAEILDKFQASGPRLDAWFDCEQSVSTTYNPNQGKYTGWDSGRRGRIQNELSTGYTRKLDIDPINSTSEDTISITGQAGYRVWEVAVVDHPEGVFSWDDETKWRIDGITLQNGSNTLQVVALDDDGVSAFGEETDSVNVNKTTDAAPAVNLDISPRSGNVALSDILSLDAGNSYDPEGKEVTFAWSSSSESVNLISSGATAAASFSLPGLYTFTVEVTDPGGRSATAAREISVYAPDGFSGFNDVWINPWIKQHDIETRDNYSPGAWWSLSESSGKLVIHIPDDKSYPLGLPPGLAETKSYLRLDHLWKYSDTNVDFMSTFADRDFDAGAWPTGKGMFGKDSGTIPAPGINTPLQKNTAGNQVSYYFRTEFEFTEDPVGAEIDLRAVIDDGARFWLNGFEIDRVRLPAGTIEHGTGASRNTSSADEKQSRQVGLFDGTGKLVNGTNIFAVDLHNSSARSSDYLFAAELDITAQALSEGGNLSGTTHPWLKRDLPDSSEWSLQTDLELLTLQFGEYMTGIIIEIEQDETRSRYAFGYKDGTHLSIAKVTSSGSVGIIYSAPFSESDDVVIRIRREADRLYFERSPSAGTWEPIHSLQPEQAPSWKAVEGGLFASTNASNSIRVSFDYLLLVAPEAASPYVGDIVITEVMYEPLAGSEYEYIEIYNAGAEPVNLLGFSLPQGNPVNAFIFPNRSLAPGEFVLVVANIDLFLAKYGAGLTSQIVGAWSGGKLNNNGEEIALLDAAGKVVTNFVYGDNAPWPTAPGSGGNSLTLSNPSTGSTSDASHWSASTLVGGTPGKPAETEGQFAGWLAARGETNPLAIKAGETINNLLTYAFGLDLGGNLATGLPLPGVLAVGGIQYLTLEYRRRIDSPNLGYFIEISNDLASWQGTEANTVEETRIPVGDGTERIKVRLKEPFGNQRETYLRLRVLAP